MNFFKKKETSVNSNMDKKLSYKEQYENLISHIDSNISQGHDKNEIIDYVINVIIQYLNYSEATYSLTSTEQTPVKENSIYFMLPFKNLIRDYNLEKTQTEISEKVLIKETPILVNPWNGDRIIDNLFGINEDNIYDGEKYRFNIINEYLVPLDIIVCNGGNHSQFAAIHKNLGSTIKNMKRDLSSLYELVKFDGTGFLDLKSKKYVFECENEIEFYAGVIFELKRPM